jgi:hypothetical protein
MKTDICIKCSENLKTRVGDRSPDGGEWRCMCWSCFANEPREIETYVYVSPGIVYINEKWWEIKKKPEK